MPKVNPCVKPEKGLSSEKHQSQSNAKGDSVLNKQKCETLEVDPSKHTMPDIGNIVREKGIIPPVGSRSKKVIEERENSPDFIDDPDVPPLI